MRNYSKIKSKKQLPPLDIDKMSGAMLKLKEQTEANFNSIFAFCKKRDLKGLQELDNNEYHKVRRKIADLTVTTSVKSLVGYYLPDF